VQNRADGNQGAIFVVEADDVDGLSPTLVWDSYTFTQDNLLDGHTGLTGNQDVFRSIGDVTMSNDGTKLIVQSVAARAGNPLPAGDVIIIPLDANGVPAIDPTLSNVTVVPTQGSGLAHSSGNQLEFDAAGNLYVANSGVSAATPALTGQLVQVFSPGGNTKATTSSTGTFTVVPFVPPVEDADFDNDGDVDGADFLTWQGRAGQAGDQTQGDADGNGQVNGADLEIWKTQFGPGGGAAAVPEPATWALAIGAAALVGVARRRRA
jgi:hypothetical protein